MLHWGTLLAMFGLLASVLLVVALEHHETDLWVGAAVFVVGCSCTGWWLLTTRDPAELRVTPARIVARWSMLCAALAFVGCLTFADMFEARGLHDLSMYLAGSPVAAMLVGVYAGATHLRSVSWRLWNHGLRSETVFLQSLLGAAVVVVVVLWLVDGFNPSGRRGLLVVGLLGCVGLVLGPGILISYLWTLEDLRRELKKARVEAREPEIPADFMGRTDEMS